MTPTAKRTRISARLSNKLRRIRMNFLMYLIPVAIFIAICNSIVLVGVVNYLIELENVEENRNG